MKTKLFAMALAAVFALAAWVGTALADPGPLDDFSTQADSQAGKLGNEIRVSTTSADNQYEPDAVGIGSSRFVAVWTDDFRDGSNNKGVFGQIFNENGEKYGTEFRCNSTTWGSQEHPAVASISSGFVVAWISQHQDYDGSEAVVFQIFDTEGNKIGSETAALRWNGVDHGAPAVAGLGSDRFMVVWGVNTGEANLVGKIFSAGGSAVTDHFLISNRADYTPADPNIAALSNGNVVVTWRYRGGDESLYSVYGRVLNQSGNAVSSEFRVNTYYHHNQLEPQVTALAEGRFVVVWSSYNQDGSSYGVYGQLFDSNGAKIGDEFRVNSYTSDSQQNPRVVALTSGGFVVTWSSENQQESGSSTIHGQLFKSDANKDGSEFLVSENTSRDKGNGAVVGMPSNRFVAVWSSNGQDGDGWGVYGQRFEITEGSGDDDGDDGDDGDGGSGTLVEQFVTRFYNHCLLRDPDAGGLRYWVNQLETGAKSGADVAKGFIWSEEFRNRGVSDSEYVTILYRAFFGREPDLSGFHYWMGRIEGGATRDEVLDGFIYSIEFVTLCEQYQIRPY